MIREVSHVCVEAAAKHIAVFLGLTLLTWPLGRKEFLFTWLPDK